MPAKTACQVCGNPSDTIECDQCSSKLDYFQRLLIVQLRGIQDVLPRIDQSLNNLRNLEPLFNNIHSLASVMKELEQTISHKDFST